MRNPSKVICVLLALSWCIPTFAQNPSVLFSSRTARLENAAAVQYRKYRALRSTARIRVADVAADVSHSKTIRLNLFPGVQFDADVVRADPWSRGYRWEGTLRGRPGRVALVAEGTQITGWIWAGGRSGDHFYSIAPLGGHAHAIRETNQEWFDSIRPGCTTGTIARPARATRAPAPLLAQSCLVNILVAYTPAAQNAHGNIPALAQVAALQTMGTYALSQIDSIRLNVIGIMPVSYVESGTKEIDGTLTDLARLQNPTDGWLDQVHAARMNLGADIVVLFANDLTNLGTNGQAYDVLAAPDTAFVVVDWESAVDNLSFAHELGHLQGARHEMTADDTTTPFSHGHATCEDTFRTVMGTVGCGVKRVPFWSNPNVKYNSTKTGDKTSADNARVLRETACTMSELVMPGLMGWKHRWGNDGNHAIHWWNFKWNDRYLVGDFDADGSDELFAVNPNGFAHLMKYDGSAWITIWANNGNGIVNSWKISGVDRFAAGDFVPGNSRVEVLAVNPLSGHAHLLAYNGSAWTTPWTNWGSGIIDSWNLASLDSRYVAGDFIAGNGTDELLAINPGSGYAHLMKFNGSVWNTPWANWGNSIIDSFKLSISDKYIAGEFLPGNNGEEVLAVNDNGYAHLMSYNGSAWNTPWANWGNALISGWKIGAADRYVAGDFISGDSGREELLAVAPNSTWAALLSYGSSGWQATWSNDGAGNIGWWYINPPDVYLGGDLISGTPGDELLSLQPLNGWAHLHTR